MCQPRSWTRSDVGTAPVPYRTNRNGTNPVFPRTSVQLGEAEITGKGGTIPAIVAYVRETARDRRRFARFCHATGCQAQKLDEGAYLVSGGPDALEQLTRHDAVRSWHYVIDGRQPRASGCGPEKKRAKPKLEPLIVEPGLNSERDELLRKLQGE